MPTHPLISYMESPDGMGQDTVSDGSASIPAPSMTPHASLAGKMENEESLDCMFCEQTFQHQDELSPHVLTQHPTTLFGPAVLRVEAEYRGPGTKSQAPEPEAELSCEVCGHTVDGGELEAHMRKHKDSFTYSCTVCGRRFKEPWFLKNHMRTHTGKSRSRPHQDPESPATINEVVQELPGLTGPPSTSPYRMCMVCGFFFPSKEVLAEHSRVHNRQTEDGDISPPLHPHHESPLSQQSFLQILGLRSQASGEADYPDRTSRWIPQLDPFNTYQAWQLATKGKIAVGPGRAKEMGPDASSDNEDSGSDKEELGEIWAGNGSSRGKPLKVELKARRTVPQTPSPEPDSKILAKDKPTQCGDCGKTFRTYHQLVLHSRIHKKERGGAESPTSSVDGRQGGAAEDGSEDGSEEGGAADNLQSERFNTSKMKILAPSRQCTYCGKSFRSNYYLNIHLRTHTGEKPYKCEYCDYAAAQKTSLRYHLERHHKDIPEAGQSGKAVSPSPPGGDTKEKVAADLAKDADCVKDCVGMSKSMPPIKVKVENKTSLLTVPHIPKLQPDVVKEEPPELPLDLSLKPALPISATSVPKTTLIMHSCPQCPYRTLYPEVLDMHKKIVHTDKADLPRKGSARLSSALRHRRHTGCPPALEGKDVPPLSAIYGKRPRRTSSPQLPTEAAQSPSRVPLVTSQRVPYKRDNFAPSSVSVVQDRDLSGQRGRPLWPVNSSRPSLSARFGSLPQGDMGEPYAKRTKLSGAPELAGGSPGSWQQEAQGRNANPLGQQRSPAKSQPFTVKTVPQPGGRVSADWNVVNVLRSYGPGDFASLYHPPPPVNSHPSVAASTTANRALLYQHPQHGELQRKYTHSNNNP